MSDERALVAQEPGIIRSPAHARSLRQLIGEHLGFALEYAELYGNPHLATAIRVAQNELEVRDAEWQARRYRRW